MAPKWLSSVKLSRLSPKAWLAQTIAKVLDEFLVLEGGCDAIESSLLSDTKIVLKGAEVRPRKLAPNVTLCGSVERVEFSWKWTKSGREGTFIKNTKLSIDGAHLRLVLDDKEPTSGDSKPQPQLPFSYGTAGADASSDDGYLQRQIQQIIDHISLDISDIRLVVEDKRNSAQLLVEAQRLQLESLTSGKNKPPRRHSSVRGSISRVIKGKRSSVASDPGSQPAQTLSHRISVENVNVSILQPTTELPIVDFVGYTATVTRVAERHRLADWTRGIKVEGEVLPSQDNSGLVLHAGNDQIAAIGGLAERIVEILLLIAKDDDASIGMQPTISGDWTLGDVSPISKVTLPIPAISVELPDNSTTILPQCLLVCRADGSVCQLSGIDGIKIDGQKPLLHFQSPGSGEWGLDLVARRVSLSTSKSNQPAAKIHWDAYAMKRIIGEVLQLASGVGDVISKGTALYPCHNPATDNSHKWTFHCDGAIEAQFTCNKDWLKTKVNCPSVQVTTQKGQLPQITKLHLAGIDVGPTSFGKTTKLHVPPIKLEDSVEGGEGIFVEGSIGGSLDSINLVPKLAEFALALLPNLPQRETQPRDDTNSQALTYLRVPGATILISSLDAELVVENIISRSPFNQVGCRRLEFNDTNGTTVALAGLKASIHPNFCAKISNIDALQLAGMGGIKMPVNGTTTVSHKDGKLHIELPQLQAKLSDDGRRKPKGNRGNSITTDLLKLPFPIHCSCPSLEVTLPILEGLATTIRNPECHIVPFETAHDGGCACQTHMVAFQGLVGSIENKFVQLGTTSASGVVKINDLSVVQQFNLATYPAEVFVGPSSVDLKALKSADKQALKSAFKGDVPSLRIPYANVGSIPLNLNWKGPVLGTKRKASTIPAFHGGPKTDSNDLIRHFQKALVEQVAATITDSKLLGPKVSEMSAKTAGAAFKGTEKVIGNVRNTIATGKKTRNAEPSAAYKFGDFTKGTFHQAINNIRKTEAEIRRNSELLAESIAQKAFKI